MTAVVPALRLLGYEDGPTMPDLLCDPCAAGNHPEDGRCKAFTVLDTDGEVHGMCCACEPCIDTYNRRFWARVRAEMRARGK